jgi:hypothetical protein
MGTLTRLLRLAPRCKTPNRSSAYQPTLRGCWQGSLLLCHGPGRHDPSCAPGDAEPMTGFCVRERRGVASACGR